MPEQTFRISFGSGTRLRHVFVAFVAPDLAAANDQAYASLGSEWAHCYAMPGGEWMTGRYLPITFAQANRVIKGYGYFGAALPYEQIIGTGLPPLTHTEARVVLALAMDHYETPQTLDVLVEYAQRSRYAVRKALAGLRSKGLVSLHVRATDDYPMRLAGRANSLCKLAYEAVAYRPSVVRRRARRFASSGATP